MYDSFIPTLSLESDNQIENADGASSDQRKTQRRTNEKGALYHAYDLQVHQFVGHLRRVHPTNPSVNMTIQSKTVNVKAADPLAPSGHPLYYYHSRTAYYDIFFSCGGTSAYLTCSRMCCHSWKCVPRLRWRGC